MFKEICIFLSARDRLSTKNNILSISSYIYNIYSNTYHCKKNKRMPKNCNKNKRMLKSNYYLIILLFWFFYYQNWCY